ncbi:MAG TPA: hypothetical protein PLV45_11475 [bacterium]|nr:hypothetical protein [bacterium]
MALVNFLKFSADSGAIISDEEYWNVFFRKRMHGDNLHSLLTADQAEKLAVQAVYGGVGYPSVHREVVVDTRERIARCIRENGTDTLQRVKDVARIAFDALQAAIRRRIDQKLQFYYGFSTDELNAGQFRVADETWPIASPEVLDKSRKLASRETRDTLLKAVLDAKAAVFGYDADGMTGYYLAGENSIMGYVHEGFEAIGSGKYASGLVFGQDFKAKTLKMRQQGYAPATGMFELIDSAYLAGEHFKEVGGNYNVVILDRAAKKPADRYRQVFDETARLATEIVRAVRAGLLPRETAIGLIEGLLFKGKSIKTVENQLFTSATDSTALELILRGYKRDEVNALIQQKGVRK